jgi:hypothetical protein
LFIIRSIGDTELLADTHRVEILFIIRSIGDTELLADTHRSQANICCEWW